MRTSQRSLGNPPLSYQFIIDGSRKYHGPSGLGIGTYEGCKILGLASSELSRVEALIKKKASTTAQTGGLKTYVLREGLYKDTFNFDICFADSLMFCATDRVFLKEVLDRRSRNASREALPDSLEQWQYVDKDAPFWAVRRFPAGVNWKGVLLRR